jgi:DNA repair exonuclease SbcCD ATPase subunit
VIRFTEIRYRNIMSVGNAWITIPLAAHPQTLIVGSNGSGKTILLEALNFALFGKPYRNFNKPQLVNTTNGRELEVELTFEVHGHTYMVRRGIKPNLFEIHRDGVKLDEDPDSRDQQDFLERTILKFNEKAFRQTIVLGSSAFVPFMRLPAAARREVIEDLLDIEVFSVMNDILKKQMSDTKKLLDNIQMRQKLMEERERLAAQYEQSLKEDQAARLKQIADERVQAQEHVQFCRNELTRLQAQFDADNDELKKFDKVVSRIGKAETAMRQVKDRMDAISKQLQFFRAHEHCPTCTQTLTEDFRTETIQNLSVQQMEQATTLKKLETLMVKLRADDVLRVQCVRKLDGVKNTMRQTQLVMAQSEAVLHSLTSQEAKVVKPVSKNFAPVTDDEKVALQQELTNTLFTQHVQNMASGLLKDSGIKTQIIDHYLPIINHLINKHLSALNFPIQFMLDAQFKETVLSRNRDTFSYESFSDGQKKRIDLAMMMTWRAVAQLRNSAYTNLLILDEVCDSSLDADGVEEFLKMLHGLEGTNTVVISHKTDQMIDKFPNVIRVAMSRGFTVVEEGATTVAA